MNVIVDLIPPGRKNRPGHVNPARYVTIHNTGNAAAGAGARNHAAYLKGDAAASGSVSWHYTVDDCAVVQHLPDCESAYHAGDGANGTGNRESIGIEICMNAGGDLRKATDNAAELTASLCKRYGIPLGNVVQHNRWTGKDCPQMLRAGKPYGWDEFIGKVRGFLQPAQSATPVQSVPPAQPVLPAQWAAGACEKAMRRGFVAGGGGAPDWAGTVSLQELLTLLDKMGLLDG
jgi:N-acetylmuramoyl-L-alanine amidase CwlA